MDFLGKYNTDFQPRTASNPLHAHTCSLSRCHCMIPVPAPELKPVVRDATIISLIVFVSFSHQEAFKMNQSGRSPLFSQDWDYVVYQRFIQRHPSVGHGNKTKESPAQKESNQHKITAVHVMEKIPKRLSNFRSAGLCFWCPFRRRFGGLGTGEMEGDDP